MLGILFIVICAVFGYELVSFLVPDVRRLYVAVSPSGKPLSKIPDVLFKIPAGIITGIAVGSFSGYYVTSLMSLVINGKQRPQGAGASVVALVFCYLIFVLWGRNRKREIKKNPKIPGFDKSVGNTSYYGIAIILFTIISSFLFFYSFRISDGYLINGNTVFSDLAPHTAMTASFGKGSNFPTQYMHYSGDGIQYHFFFYFFCGMLEFLGLPIDYAINIPSILSMVCCFILLGLLAMLLSGKRLTFVLAPVLVLFRSSFNIYSMFVHLREHHYDLKRILGLIVHSFSWYDQSPYDNWGIWSVNVYCNQRHLLFGVSMILILIILFIPHVRRMSISLMKGGYKDFLFSRNAWIPRNSDPLCPVRNLILALILVTVMPFIHGSALIAGLLILAFMAIVSEARLNYLIMATLAVISSFIQTYLFAGSYRKVVMFEVSPGFVSRESTFHNSLDYLIYITGFTLFLTAVFAVGWLIKDLKMRKPIYRFFLVISFLIPLIFAFVFKVSLEMLANHKFVQISLILSDIFVATVLTNLIILPVRLRKGKDLPKLLPLNNDELEEELNKESAKKPLSIPLAAYIPSRILSVIIALVLIFGLTATGITEWITYYNINRYHIDVDTNSELVSWIEENTSPQDVFLTPMWSVNRFFLAGRPAYYGWPYYAWSAGHDTYTRDSVYLWLISGCGGDIDTFVSYCRERGIKYLVFDPEFCDMKNANGKTIYAAEFFASNLKQVAYFPHDNNTIVYQIY
ncbi:MAG: hypothetical protein K6F83_01760 [Clostridiales bacterium]|nr:hypothetical protein [Clostridiales bacterium]